MALNPKNDIAVWLALQHAQFEQELEARLPDEQMEPSRLHMAMRYSTLSGGKRIRPLLVYAAGQAVGVPPGKLHAMACSVELIHAYSLIHDDLPAMDDDALRRGRATCHLEFDEATAILAGDALQALAFKTLTDDLFERSDVAVELVQKLSLACGSNGMAGGQMLDLQVVGNIIDINQLETIHKLKTGALIVFSVAAPALLAAGSDAWLGHLEQFGQCVGLGFQIQDDILDVTGNPDLLGKDIHADADRSKPTFPSLIGLKASAKRAALLRDEAMSCLEQINGDTSALAWLADHMIQRDR